MYPFWVAAHGIAIIAPVYWHQAASPLKRMIDRLVCADGATQIHRPVPSAGALNRMRHAREVRVVKRVSTCAWARSECPYGVSWAHTISPGWQGTRVAVRPRRLNSVRKGGRKAAAKRHSK
jgi:hypothetical protein